MCYLPPGPLCLAARHVPAGRRGTRPGLLRRAAASGLSGPWALQLRPGRGLRWAPGAARRGPGHKDAPLQGQGGTGGALT